MPNFSSEGIFNHNMSSTRLSVVTNSRILFLMLSTNDLDHDLKEGMSVALPHLRASQNDYKFLTVLECSQAFKQFSNIFIH